MDGLLILVVVFWRGDLSGDAAWLRALFRAERLGFLFYFPVP
jgi:hypothetical protein